jgi:alkanesulfonate monooxygenase SsuD/methylene tetrahydromethanopterin reductase-like flavin-dependent oxidoreductase (luciferase family)
MHVGMSPIFQNPGGTRQDSEVWDKDLALSELAEPLGFDSIWVAEHHFTDYTMCPNPLQFLTYMAGRTSRVELGSMVVVLPWHQPARVAEEVAVLDHVSGGRAVLGIGRGIGRIEFDGLGAPMQESRQMFTESADMIIRALETGVLEYDGEIVQQERRDLRPRPFRSFKGRTYAAAVSPESMRIMAELGVGVLVIPQKPWDVVENDLATYRGIYLDVNGVEAPQTVIAEWVFCDEDPGRAREMARRYVGTYYEMVMAHYELAGRHFGETAGYDYYAKMSERLASAGSERAIDFFVDLAPWGTPRQCYEKIVEMQRRLDGDRFIGVFSYGGMTPEEGERNMRLFAREVLPELQKYPAARTTPDHAAA